MKWKFMAKTVGFILAALGLTDFPVNAENQEIDLSAEQEEKLKAMLGKDYEEVKANINKELKAFAENDFDLKAIADELEAARQSLALKTDEESGVPEAAIGNLPIDAQIKALTKKYDDLFAKLVNEPVGDTGKVIQLNGKRMNHSATHVNGSGMEWDAFEGGRHWNERAAGIKAGVSDFNTTVDVPLLQGDIEHYVRKNPTALASIFDDFEGLPKDWAEQSGIVDRVVSGLVAVSEITQGDNGGWNPKGEVLIEAEVGRVFDKKIDITLTGEQLKKIEKMWISFLNGNDGSHPWKTTFVGFILGFYIQQAMLDSRIAMVNGIYVKTPKALTGMNVNSQNGLRAYWYYFRDVVKKYKPFDLGDPTKENICDYIKQMIELIPEKKRNLQGYEIQISHELLLWYKERAGEFYQLHYSTDQGKTTYDGIHPLNYPNFKFQPLIDQTQTLFIGIVNSKNVEKLTYRENEKGEFTMTHEKRDTNLFADFKEGIRFIQVGRIWTEGEPKEFDYQMLYSNTCPIFSSTTRVPLFDRGSTTVALDANEFFPHFEIVQNDYGRDIVNITGVVPGQIVTITGNETLAANRLVKSNANLLIGADFQLNTGGTLTMIVQSDRKLKKLFATTEPQSTTVETDQTFTAATIDANTGSVFNSAAVADLTVTNIINGVDGKTIAIYGTDAVGIETTIAAVVDKIVVASTAVLASSEDYIELTRSNGVWYESKRVIA